MPKSKVFMVMPFSDEHFELYEMIKGEFTEHFEFSNAAQEGNQQNILKDIIQPIYEANIIIADLTGLNPNVMYELGLAHTFNKKTIVITQDNITNLPFDLKQYRAKEYSTHFKKFADLIEYLKTNLYGAVNGDVEYSNPVKDFLTLSGIDGINWFSNENISTTFDESEKGFLDFIADIEDDITEMTNNIQNMCIDLNTMTTVITNSTDEIERIKKNSGAGTASFVRKETKKVAKSMDVFSTKLKQYNTNISLLWDRSEKNTLGLLENDFSTTDTNREGLVFFLRGLNELQTSIHSSSQGVSGMKEASLHNMGMERSLNQSIRFLDQDLYDYLYLMERMTASIEKIKKKSRFIVGDIDLSPAIENAE